MPWRETNQKGIFLRPLGENETFIKLVGDTGLPLNREHWAINSTAAIEPVGAFASFDLETLFRLAWSHLRFQHPSLAAEVTPDNKNLVYEVPSDGAALDAWVSQTFSVAHTAGTAADVIPTFRPTPYAKLVFVPRSGELIVHTSHWRTDGLGALLLLDAFLALASSHSQTPLADPVSLSWGNEIERLTPAVEDAANIPKEPTQELKQRGSEYVATFAHTVGAVGIPYQGNVETLPGGTHETTLVFSPETTAKVVASCKERGVTVTAAVHASISNANHALSDSTSKQKHHTSTIRFALRPYLPEPYSTPAFAAGLYTTGWMKRIEPQATWSERLQSFQYEYRKGITRDFLDSHREYAAQLGELIRNTPPGGDPPSDVDISSVGIAENLIRQSYGASDAGFKVNAIRIGVEMLTRQATIFVWTFRDQLNLNAVYNTSFHSKKQMDQFLAMVESQLLAGLCIDE